MTDHCQVEIPSRTRGTVLSAMLLPLAVAAAVVGNDFEISRSTVDGGGTMFSAGGEFELSATVGQPDDGLMANADFQLIGGFWFPQAPGDCNLDGGVNLFDHATFETCISGPEDGTLAPPCICFDLDADGDVDLNDVGAFHRSFNG